MPVFFSQRRGTVVRVGNRAGLNASPFAVRVQGTPLGVADQNLPTIITQAAFRAEGNVQFQHAADETIYGYIFGDRVGTVRVGGMAFASYCGNAQSGLDVLLTIYRQFRAAALGRPCRVRIGNNVVKAMLTAMSFNLSDPEHEMAEWGFEFAGLTALPGREP